MTSRHTDPDLTGTSACTADGAVCQGYLQLVDIGMEDLIDEANTRALIRVLVRQLDMNLPQAAFEWG